MRNAGADPASRILSTTLPWAFWPNHAPLFLRSGAQGLPQVTRSRLTGAARTDNRRHRCVGHLCQNRNTSLVGEDDADCRDLGSSLLRNSLRAGLIPDLDPSTGILGVATRVSWAANASRDWIEAPCWLGLGGRSASRFSPTAAAGAGRPGSVWRNFSRGAARRGGDGAGRGHLRPGAMISTEGK